MKRSNGLGGRVEMASAAAVSLVIILASCSNGESPNVGEGGSATHTATALPVPDTFDPTDSAAWSILLPDEAPLVTSGDLLAYVETTSDAHVVHLVNLLSGEETWTADVPPLLDPAEGDSATPVVRFAAENVAIFQDGLLVDSSQGQYGFSVTVLAGTDGSVVDAEERPVDEEVGVTSTVSMVARVTNTDGFGRELNAESFVVRQDGIMQSSEGVVEVPCESDGMCQFTVRTVEALADIDVFSYKQPDTVDDPDTIDPEATLVCTDQGTDETGNDFPVCASGFGTDSWTSAEVALPGGARNDPARLVGVSAEVVVGEWPEFNGAPSILAAVSGDGSLLATVPDCGAGEREQVRISPNGRYAVISGAIFDLQDGTGRCTGQALFTAVGDDGVAWGLDGYPDHLVSEGEAFIVDVATGIAEAQGPWYPPLLLTTTGMGVFLAPDAPGGQVLAGYPTD